MWRDQEIYFDVTVPPLAEKRGRSVNEDVAPQGDGPAHATALGDSPPVSPKRPQSTKPIPTRGGEHLDPLETRTDTSATATRPEAPARVRPQRPLHHEHLGKARGDGRKTGRLARGAMGGGNWFLWRLNLPSKIGNIAFLNPVGNSGDHLLASKNGGRKGCAQPYIFAQEIFVSFPLESKKVEGFILA